MRWDGLRNDPESDAARAAPPLPLAPPLASKSPDDPEAPVARENGARENRAGENHARDNYTRDDYTWGSDASGNGAHEGAGELDAPGEADRRPVSAAAGGPAQPSGLAQPLPLALPGAVARTFDTPGFAGMTFYEIRAKSIINKVPGASKVPFSWTINPYRGCSHACTYCFARNTHTYLDLDAGHDFDTRIIVKVNAGELLRHELAAPRWSGEHIAMGTNVDVYQRAEGRYRLMPQILAALRDFANPFSILTKGTLILRDLPLLRQAASAAPVGLSMSIGFVDERIWREVEPGTPSPRRRLDALRQLTDAGFDVGVLMAPILPGLTDTAESIEETVAAIGAAGAVSVTPLPLHLRTGAREWYLGWLARARPDLVPRYRELFSRGAYSPAAYQREITARVRIAARRAGIGGGELRQARLIPVLDEADRPAHTWRRRGGDEGTQLTLL